MAEFVLSAQDILLTEAMTRLKDDVLPEASVDKTREVSDIHGGDHNRSFGHIPIRERKGHRMRE